MTRLRRLARSPTQPMIRSSSSSGWPSSIGQLEDPRLARRRRGVVLDLLHGTRMVDGAPRSREAPALQHVRGRTPDVTARRARAGCVRRSRARFYSPISPRSPGPRAGRLRRKRVVFAHDNVARRRSRPRAASRFRRARPVDFAGNGPLPAYVVRVPESCFRRGSVTRITLVASRSWRIMPAYRPRDDKTDRRHEFRFSRNPAPGVGRFAWRHPSSASAVVFRPRARLPGGCGVLVLKSPGEFELERDPLVDVPQVDPDKALAADARM